MNTNRRGFLGMGALAGAAALAGGKSAKAAAKSGGDVKFCVFADIHYRPGGFPHSTKEWLGRVLQRAERENCDFVIHCGDFCHNPKEVQDYVDYYNNFKLPTYHTIGNHDDDGCTHEETLKSYGIKCGYYHFDMKGFRFIVVDANHVRWADGRLEHYSKGSYYRKDKVPELKPYYDQGKKDVIGLVDPDQLVWLKKTIDESPYPCICFSHQSFERLTGNACGNAEEVLAIFDEANAKTPGKVRMAINGHHHCDFISVRNNVMYFDLNSASFYWMGSRYAHNHYPEEFFRKNGQTKRKVGWVTWDDPINAIVTVSADGRIRIDGMESRFAYGVQPGQCNGFRLDSCGRPCLPRVQSADMKFNYA